MFTFLNSLLTIFFVLSFEYRLLPALYVQVPESPAVQVDSRVQQAKKFAVAQAQQEGCLGNYRSFDSPFGNYLVPVIPTRADLFGE